jgi:hypothetical protein
MWRRCAAGWALLAVTAAVVAGCGSEPSHGATPPPGPPTPSSAVASPSVTTSPTATRTPTPSVTPFVSSADEAGAYAFVKAYFAELDRAYATGDVSGLVPYREATCSCILSEKDIDTYYKSGGRLSGARHTILKFATGDRGPLFFRVGVYFRAATITNHDPHGPARVTPALVADLFIDLSRLNNRWTMRDARIKVLG